MAYPSLESELRVGEVYLRLLLDGTPKTLEIHTPGRFFNELYHRLLWEGRPEIRLLCLQGMALTYQTYHAAIGPFADTSHVIHLLSRTTSREERDRYLLLVRALLASTANAKRFIKDGGLPELLHLLTTVHLEVERSAHSQVLQSNLLTLPDKDAAKEWYVRLSPPEQTQEEEEGGAAAVAPAAERRRRRRSGRRRRGRRHGRAYGPFDPTARLAAQHGGPAPHDGCEVWAGHGRLRRALEWRSPRGAARPWGASRTAAHPLVHRWALVLDLFLGLTQMHPTRTAGGALIHPMPTPKKVLSHGERMPHLVQLLLTMEPSIVERAASLLTRLVEDNPYLPRLYLSGAFYFALMYTGSNVLPIIQFLRVAHLSQLYREADEGGGGGGGGGGKDADAAPPAASRAAPT